MTVHYQTNLATSDNQDESNASLASILAAIQALAGGASQSQELAAIQMLSSLVATSAKQDTGNSSLASILAGMATAAKQDSSQVTRAAILAALGPLATASAQAAGNASLASIDAKIGSTVSTISSVAQSPTSVILLSANVNRRGLYLYNDSSVKVSVAFAATATVSAFTFILNANSGYESPQTAVYRGAISAIWNSGTSGFMRITELT